MERVAAIEFHAPERRRDLLWRRASMTVTDGPEGDVYLPVLYAGAADGADDGARLGRITEWQGGERHPGPRRRAALLAGGRGGGADPAGRPVRSPPRQTPEQPMAKDDGALLLSVLDRLLADEAEPAMRGGVQRGARSLAEIRNGVRRDLENLLNTRAAADRLARGLGRARAPP